MPSHGALAEQQTRRLRLLRRAPFFRDNWNETYGWHVAAYLAALIGCVVGFVAIAQAITDGELITDWDRRLNHWINVHSSAGLDRAFELYTHVGSFAGLLPVAVVAIALLL